MCVLLLFSLCRLPSVLTLLLCSSTNPYLVVQHTDWVQCRYLIVQRGTSYNYSETAAADAAASASVATPAPAVKLMKLDPTHPINLSNVSIGIPDVADKLKKLEENVVNSIEEFNDSDTELMKEPPPEPTPTSLSTGAAGGNGGGRLSKLKRALSGANVGSSSSSSTSKSKGKAAEPPAPPAKPVDTFEPCSEDRLKLFRPLPPPTNPSRGALAQLQRETRAMMKSQEEQGSIQAGFYLDPVRFPPFPPSFASPPLVVF